MIRKTSLFGLTLLLLGACASNTPGGTTFAELRSYLPGVKAPDAPLSARYQALFNAGPEAGLIASFPGIGKPAGMLREAKNGTIESFLGSDETAVILDRGLLVGTRGVGAGMLGSDVNPSADLVLGRRSGTADRIHTFLVRDNQTDIRAYRCQITHGGTDTITIAERTFRVRAATESCTNNTQSFENTYLVNTATNRIIRSSQWTGPERGNLLMDYVVDF